MLLREVCLKAAIGASTSAVPAVAQTKQGRFLTVAKKAPLFRPHRSKVGLFLVPCGGRGWARPLCASGSVLCVLKAECIVVGLFLVPSGGRGWARPLCASGSVLCVLKAECIAVGLFLVPGGGRGWARPLCASGSVLCVLKAAGLVSPQRRRRALFWALSGFPLSVRAPPSLRVARIFSWEVSHLPNPLGCVFLV